MQTRSTCRSNIKGNIVWEKSNEAYPLSIRVQTTKPHFDLLLLGMNVKENVFSSEREFKKALYDTLMPAAWYELLSTMANCGKIVTFLCLGISIISLSNYTKTIIRLRLVNIGEYSPRLRLGEYLTIRPVARKGYGSIAHEARPNGLLTRGP